MLRRTEQASRLPGAGRDVARPVDMGLCFRVGRGPWMTVHIALREVI